jgi:hypothetical protein
MIIHAARRFTCAHQYVATATTDGERWVFVCDGCAHRTELLPLSRDTSLGQLLPFPSPSVGLGLGEAASGHRQSSLFQTA